MPKILSAWADKQLQEQHSDAELVGLMVIYPVDGSDPIRLCTHPVTRFSVDPLRYGLMSRGEKYQFVAVGYVLPDSNREELPRTSIQMDNIDPAVVKAARSSIYRASIDLETVMSARPDEVVERFPGMEITEANWDDATVTIAISYESLATTPLVKHRMTVTRFPGLRSAAT